MTTLADIASPEAQDDFQELLNALYPPAQQHLAKHGEFFPFAASVRMDGEVAMIFAMPSDDERPPSQDVIDACNEALVSQRGSIRSGAIVSDVRIRPPLDGDALRVDFVHMDGTALVGLLQYAQKPGGEIDYRDLSVLSGRRRVWTSA